MVKSYAGRGRCDAENWHGRGYGVTEAIRKPPSMDISYYV